MEATYTEELTSNHDHEAVLDNEIKLLMEPVKAILKAHRIPFLFSIQYKRTDTGVGISTCCCLERERASRALFEAREVIGEGGMTQVALKHLMEMVSQSIEEEAPTA